MMTAGEREKWLLERRKGLGASDTAAVLGISKWESAYSVWLDKCGLVPLDFRMTPQQEWGLRHEPAIALAYEDKIGCALSQPRTIQHPKHPWMLASIDRISDAGRVVELKTARSSDGWGEEGTDQVPEEYIVQVTKQLLLARDAMQDTIWESGDIATLIGLSDFRIYRVPFHQELAETIIEIEAEFWRFVETRIEPPPDWEHPDTPKLIEIIRRPEKHKTIFLPPDAAVLELAEEARLLTEQRHEFERQAEELHARERVAKAQLSMLMGDAAVGILSNGFEVKRTVFGECDVKASRRPARTQIDIRRSK